MSVPDSQVKICSCCQRQYKTPEDFYKGTSRWRICDMKNLWFNCSCESTLVIKQGKYDWYSPAKTMSPGSRGIFNSLPALHQLPRIQSSVMELQQQFQNKDLEMAELARSIKRDPFIASNILTMANNMKSNRSPGDKKKIESIEHALMYVGRKTVEDLLLTVSLKSFKSETKVFNVERYWKEAILAGDIAESIADKFQIKVNKDELYISAMLCNVGKVVTAICIPHGIDCVETVVNQPKTLTTWQTAEQQCKTPDHCVLGEIGAALWGLPPFVNEAIVNHHKMPKDNRAGIVGLTIPEIVAFANQLGHWILLRPSRIDQTMLDKFCHILQLSKETLEQFAETLLPLAKRAA
jgi:HD-like signal output (HDOD) protein